MHIEFDNGYFEQMEDVYCNLLRRRKNARRRTNLIIDAAAGVDKDLSGDERTDVEIDDRDGFIVAYDVVY